MMFQKIWIYATVCNSSQESLQVRDGCKNGVACDGIDLVLGWFRRR